MQNTTPQDIKSFFPHAWRRPALVASCALMVLMGGCRGEGSGTGAPTQGATVPGTASGALKSANQAPVITGQLPGQVLVGHTFSYTVQASDPDGDDLTYAASGLPEWVTLDPDTGTLRGKPDSAAIGTYSGISISVSDGTTTSTLAGQTLTVVDSASGAATLSWLPPTGNEDGSPLEDLAGYRIRYGTDPSHLYQTVEIPTSGVSSYVVENLTPGSWYFVMTAYTASGHESRPTSAVSKTI
jgi:hypothetical protein